MALQDLLDLTNQRKKIGLSQERVEAVLPIVRQYIAFWREYPDLFIDFMVRGTRTEPKEGEFQFYFYQRVFLRCVMRYQYVYAVFPRAYSKSFLSVMALMIRCILYPGAHLFVTSGGKEQGASILHDKVQELCELIPTLKREIDWGRGKTQEGKDRVRYVFKNGSVLDNLAARESTRGQRRHGNEKNMTLLRSIFYKYIIYIFIYNINIEKGVYIMLGYIYFITNTVTGKKYIGETINFKERKNKHLSYLRKDSHHSNKLQRAYNKYGEDNFEWSYEIYEIENEAELKIIEQKKIAEYDTYYNGYNCTLGGEGHNLIFDYNTASILYQILQRYEGVNRQIARFFNCDHTVINKLKNNNIYKDEIIEEEIIKEMINRLKLSENNLKDNYIPHNVKKLNKKQIFEILSIILDEKGYDNLLADIYNIDTKLLYRLKKNEIYIDYINEYNKLSHDEKINLKEEVKNKYDLEHQRLNRKRGNIKNALTQEQINYILDNKDSKKRVEIAKELEISADRVGSVINGKSYKDLVEKYYSSKNKLPC